MRTLKITSILMLIFASLVNLALAQKADKKAGKKKDKTLIDTAWVAPKPTEDVVDVPKLKDSIAVLKDRLFEAEHLADSISKANYQLEEKVIKIQAENYTLRETNDTLRTALQSGKKGLFKNLPVFSPKKKEAVLVHENDSLKDEVDDLKAENYNLKKVIDQKQMEKPKEIEREISTTADDECEKKNAMLLEENRALSKTNFKLQTELEEAKKSASKDSKQPAVAPKEQKEPNQNCTELVEKVEKLLPKIEILIKNDSLVKRNEVLVKEKEALRGDTTALKEKLSTCLESMLDLNVQNKRDRDTLTNLREEYLRYKNRADYCESSSMLRDTKIQALEKQIGLYRDLVSKEMAIKIEKDANLIEDKQQLTGQPQPTAPAEKTEKKEEKKEEAKKEEKDPWADIKQ